METREWHCHYDLAAFEFNWFCPSIISGPRSHIATHLLYCLKTLKGKHITAEFV